MVQPPGFHSGTNNSVVCPGFHSGTEEVPLWTEASPACLEREDHVATATDGLCNCDGWAFSPSLFIRKGRLGPVSILLYVNDLVIIGADLSEIDRVKLQLAA